ncbi:hypothetical protein RB600_002523 [Gaeumannomyces tritici]
MLSRNQQRVCFQDVATASRCLITDDTCFCGPQITESAMLQCGQERCSKVDLMALIRLTRTTCGQKPKDSKAKLRAQQCSWVVISSLCVIARLVRRLLDRGPCPDWAVLRVEDVCVSLTYLFCLAVYTFAAALASMGLGREFWALNTEQISKITFFLYLTQIFHAVAIGLLRCSFLVFYWRVFTGKGCGGSERSRRWGPGGRWKFRQILLWTIVDQSGVSIASLLAAIFQCWPIYKTWEGWRGGAAAGVCVQPTTLILINASICIATGLWILCLPLSQLRTLDLTREAVIGVGIMLCMGTIVSMLSILRLAPTLRLKQVFLVLGGPAAMVSWTTAELTAGIVCVCMPSIHVVGFRVLAALLAHTPWRLPDRDFSSLAASPFGAAAGLEADKMVTASTDALADREGRAKLYPLPSGCVAQTYQPTNSSAPSATPASRSVGGWTAPSSWGGPDSIDNAPSRSTEETPSSSRKGSGAEPVRRIVTPDYFVPRRFPPSEGKRRNSRSAPDTTGSRFNAPFLPVRVHQGPISTADWRTRGRGRPTAPYNVDRVEPKLD